MLNALEGDPLMRTSSTSLTKLEKILDDNGEGTKRVEEMLGSACPVKKGHPSFMDGDGEHQKDCLFEPTEENTTLFSRSG
ncbi:hypothetical protein RB195_012761 [Necator americanus]|uniref:Uncharacterized protein n=1 Tax=Necator americanus TaxID=51031 RepID=A0ABR1DTW8_NECAM